ncbi:hypothetical protein HCDSEM_127 [Candidatus Hodgkinia cicadicola Dsem]|nr:hypothetical protein HCDSEM_127 [Candidatus Hodgkinia cicadicola Dsem]
MAAKPSLLLCLKPNLAGSPRQLIDLTTEPRANLIGDALTVYSHSGHAQPQSQQATPNPQLSMEAALTQLWQ